MTPAKISLILLNYNSSRYTIQCVESIHANCPTVDYEIIVVDNCSTEKDFAQLRKLTGHSAVKIVRSRINLGFAGGNMHGIQFANPAADYYFFLNNDCILCNDVCELLTGFMEANPSVGICTAQMYTEREEPTPSFTYFPSPGVDWLGHGFMRWLRPDTYPNRNNTYAEPLQVPVVSGSAMFVRATAFKAVGGFDTMYFFYCEEEDLCRRITDRGYSVALVPEARFIHFSGKSTHRNLAIEKEFYISQAHYLRKFHNRFEIGLFRLFHFFKNLRKFRRSPVYAQVAWFILRNCPVRESLRYRQSIENPNRTLTESVVVPNADLTSIAA